MLVPGTSRVKDGPPSSAPPSAELSSKLWKMAMLSFPGGLPLGVVVTLVPAWLSHQGLTPSEIGLLQLAGLPWSFKFLWAPALDRVRPPWLDRRRGWILLMQLLMIPAVGALALIDAHAATLVGLATLTIALLSATQDVAMDAYAVEVMEPREQGPGNALRVTFYRLAMIAAGGLAIAAADTVSWPVVFMALALIFVPALGLTTIAEPPPPHDDAPRTFASAVVEPLRALWSRESMGAILLLLVLYKLGDNLASAMVPTFFIQHLHVSLTELGTLQKGLGLAMTIVGTLIGGFLLPRIGLGRALWIFGFLQAATNLTYAWASWAEGARIAVYASITAENLVAGMGGAALVTLMTRVTDRRYAAAHFALLSSVASLSRTIAAPPGGMMVEALGYTQFFVATAVLGLPGLVLLAWVAPWGAREVRGAADQGQPVPAGIVD